MLVLKNMTPEAFKAYAKEKKVYIFGAGRALESCLDLYFADRNIAGIVDNNAKLWGSIILHNQQGIAVMGPDMFVNEIQGKLQNSVLMITSPFYAVEIVEQLDRIPQLDGLECFLQVLIRNAKTSNGDFEFTKGPQKIPKKIHYIWVGGKPLPYEYEKNIETWRRWNPDYEIIRWDESNYDFTKADYVREAYETKNWGFASNFARLDIIYQNGGIYLDTDVEVLRNLDCLLNDDAFMCMGCADRLNNGCGFGAGPGNQLIGGLRDAFEKSHFLNKDGKPAKRPCHAFMHPVLKQYGFQIENVYQNIGGVALYPTEVMSPQTMDGLPGNFTNKTVSVHRESGTWRNETEQNGVLKLNKIMKERIFED